MVPSKSVKACRDCKYSVADTNNAWELHCVHPVVNAKDAWALATARSRGTNTLHERDKDGWLLWRKPCGMRGALWQAMT